MNKRYEYAAVILLVTVFLGLTVTSVLRKSVTVEEFAHLPAGLYAWKTRYFSLYGQVPHPGRMLITGPALLLKPQVDTVLDRFPKERRPWIYATDFMQRNLKGYSRLFLVSRLVVILSGAALCLVVWRIAREGYGEWGALFALAAAAASPTLIAHSRLATTDAPAALFSILFLAMLMDYFEGPDIYSLLKMTLFFCLAALVDFTCLFWALFLLAAPLFAALTYFTESVDRPSIPAALTHIFMALLASWLIFAGAYMLKDVGAPYDREFKSEALKKLGPVARYTLLPPQFIENLDRNLARTDQDEWTRENYLLGEWHRDRNLHYFATAWLVKEPVSHLAILLLAVLLALIRRSRDRDEVILIMAIFGFFAFATFFGDQKQGIKYLLPIFPAAFVLMGRVGQTFLEPVPERPRGLDVNVIKVKLWKKALRISGRIMAAAVLVWLLLQHAMIWPDYIPYFNLVAQRQYNTRELLLGPNLDWGQDLPGLSRWIEKNGVDGIDLAYFGHDDPGRFDMSYNLPGRATDNNYIAISANLLMGQKHPMTFLTVGVRPDDPLWDEVTRYRAQEPEAVIGGSIFIFNNL
jgi:hypothetical protein